ncbi:MAG: cell division protein FtsX [Bacteroidetes bacterium]|nr:MAG: cell division protein FtsX [Bacteroidota bacterium]
MYKNYLKTAIRNLWKHRVFSFINLTGLAVGMAAFFLIFLYVRFELSYDSFHTKADRIYRIVSDIKTSTETFNADGPSWAVPPNAKQEFPEIESFARLLVNDDVLIRKGDIKFLEYNVMWADSPFFKIFDFKLLKGDPNKALVEPFSVVFSESTAKKYFGNADPIGQTVIITGATLEARVTGPAKVTGVMKDIPENSQIKGDIIISMSTIQKFATNLDNQWGVYGAQAYLLLKPGTNAVALERKFPAFLENRHGTEMKKWQRYPTLFLEPLKDVYLRSTRNGSKTGNINNVYIFSVIGLFILLIACINFINITTARSSERAKEVGIRKVVGAVKFQLTRQFLVESVIICLVAFALAVQLCLLLLPLFNHLSGKVVANGIFEHPQYLLTLFLISLGIGLIAGIYPALVLSSFIPITVLKGRFSSSTKGLLLRKGLVIAQFTISIALIVATIIVYSQLTYMRNQNLGFDKNQVMIIDAQGDSACTTFKQEISGVSGVNAVALSSSVPGSDNPSATSEIENTKGSLQIANLDLYFVDFDYLNLYKIKVLAGRGFSRDFMTDTAQAMILNEAAIKILGYSSPQQAVGKRFRQWFRERREGKIIGVVQDFHSRSLQQQIRPLSMLIEPNTFYFVSASVNPGNLQNTIGAIEKSWKRLMPNRPFSYYFFDEFFNKQYAGEEKFGNLFVNFAILAIFISCLGLLGLASYSTIQRTKEIGIRKVMGASVSNIVNLLSIDFLKLVLIAFVIAAPIAWLTMSRWLRDFAYRVNLQWWIFLSAGLLAILIAFLTISVQAIRAAVSNPVKSLRTE